MSVEVKRHTRNTYSCGKSIPTRGGWIFKNRAHNIASFFFLVLSILCLCKNLVVLLFHFDAFHLVYADAFMRCLSDSSGNDPLLRCVSSGLPLREV